MLMRTILLCPPPRKYVIPWHQLRVVMLNDHDFTVFSSQMVRDLVTWASCCNADEDDLPCTLLRMCVILCHEPPATMVMRVTLPYPLLRECVISCHELPAEMLMMTTLPPHSWCMASWHEIPCYDADDNYFCHVPFSDSA